MVHRLEWSRLPVGVGCFAAGRAWYGERLGVVWFELASGLAHAWEWYRIVLGVACFAFGRNRLWLATGRVYC